MFTTLTRAPSATAFCRTASPAGVSPVGERGQRVGELDAAVVRPGPGLGLRDRLVAAVDARGVAERVRLDVQVDPGHVVGGDQLLEDPGDPGHAGAAVGQLRAGGVRRVAAERRDDVAAPGLDGGDVRAEGRRGDGLRGVAVPVRRARAGCRGLQKGQGQVPGPGRLGQGGQAAVGGVVGLEVRGEHVRGQRAAARPGARTGRRGAGRRGRGAQGGRRDQGRGGGGQDRPEGGASSHARILLPRAAPGAAAQTIHGYK